MCAAMTVVIMLATAAALRAQTDDFKTTARMRLGPLYLNPVLQIRELGVDTNVFNTFDDPKSDFTATLGPEIESWLPLGRRILITAFGGVDVV